MRDPLRGAYKLSLTPTLSRKRERGKGAFPLYAGEGIVRWTGDYLPVTKPIGRLLPCGGAISSRIALKVPTIA